MHFQVGVSSEFRDENFSLSNFSLVVTHMKVSGISQEEYRLFPNVSYIFVTKTITTKRIRTHISLKRSLVRLPVCSVSDKRSKSNPCCNIMKLSRFLKQFFWVFYHSLFNIQIIILSGRLKSFRRKRNSFKILNNIQCAVFIYCHSFLQPDHSHENTICFFPLPFSSGTYLR